jgi:TonB family protein
MIERGAARPGVASARFAMPRPRLDVAIAVVAALALHLPVLYPVRASASVPAKGGVVPTMRVRVLPAVLTEAESVAAVATAPLPATPVPAPVPETPSVAGADLGSKPVAPAHDVAAQPSAATTAPIAESPEHRDARVEPRPPAADTPLRHDEPAQQPLAVAEPAIGSLGSSPIGGAPSKPAVALALPPAPDYLFGAQLDPGPRPLDDIEPQYPEEGQLQEGTVVLRLLIGDTGHLDNVAVVRSYPKGLFDRAALAAFTQARFAPGMVLGTPVKSQLTIEVHFAPFNRGSRVSGRGY